MKKSKVILALVCAVLLVCASVLGTLAYLTSTDEVTNTFTVGQVKITLDEAKVDGNGKALTGDDAERVKANSYKLFPGHAYDKDPTVTVKAGSEESYVKMTVTVNKSAELDQIFATHNIKLTDVITGYDATNWLYKGNTEDTAANTRTYTFYYKETVSAPTADVVLDDLFETITIPGSLTNEEINLLYYKTTKNEKNELVAGTEVDSKPLTITVKAYAIQADGFEDTKDEATGTVTESGADKAWKAFDASTPTT